MVNNMSLDQDQQDGRRPLSPVAVLVIAPMLYLASIGPMYGLYARGYISQSAWNSIGATVYRPIVYLAVDSPLAESEAVEAHVAYVHLFDP